MSILAQIVSAAFIIWGLHLFIEHHNKGGVWYVLGGGFFCGGISLLINTLIERAA